MLAQFNVSNRMESISYSMTKLGLPMCLILILQQIVLKIHTHISLPAVVTAGKCAGTFQVEWSATQLYVGKTASWTHVPVNQIIYSTQSNKSASSPTIAPAIEEQRKEGLIVSQKDSGTSLSCFDMCTENIKMYFFFFIIYKEVLTGSLITTYKSALNSDTNQSI